MTYEIYRYIFYGGMALSAAMLVTSIVLFIVLRIPNVIGDLTGANARKAIENIRSQNEESGAKNYKPSAVNQERGKVTEKMTKSGRLIKNNTGPIAGHKTAKISTMKLDPECLPADETTVLSEPAPETTVLSAPASETTVLQPEMGGSETTVLDQFYAASAPVAEQPAVFSIDLEITYIHTIEVIE